VYLSGTNNTKAIAAIIQKNTGGTLVALELEKTYPQNTGKLCSRSGRK
jgi:flavodoxin